MMTRKNTEYCQGCTDDFYNQNGGMDGKGCWHLQKARVVTRYKIGWWVQPTSKSAFTKVRLYHCNYAPGVYELREQLPNFENQ